MAENAGDITVKILKNNKSIKEISENVQSKDISHFINKVATVQTSVNDFLTELVNADKSNDITEGTEDADNENDDSDENSADEEATDLKRKPNNSSNAAGKKIKIYF